MGVLRPARAMTALLAASVLAAPGAAREAEGWRDHAGEAAARFGLPEAWVLAVIAAESGGRTHLGGQPITSHAGAMGLMQLMPATWAALRAQYGLGSDPHDPRENIIAGTAYLRAMYDRFGYPGLFAAYNAGPGRYGEYLDHGRPLPRETRAYVARLTGRAPPASRRAAGFGEGADAAPERPRETIFFVQRARSASVAAAEAGTALPAGRTSGLTGPGSAMAMRRAPDPLFFIAVRDDDRD